MPVDDVETAGAATAVSPAVSANELGARAGVSVGGGEVSPGVSRSLGRQAVHDTLASRGARVGLVWLTLLAFFAVFSPFIASSHPLLMKVDGRITSPLVRNLTPADVLFLVATFTAIALSITRRFTFSASVLILLGVVAACAVPARIWVKPEENISYDRYRVMEAEQRVQWAVYAPIRYSPRDRSFDVDRRLQEPSKRYWFGTDTNGADVLSNILHASRIALSIGFIATGISVVVGILFGGLMGYYTGWVDLLGMRFIEMVEAPPRIILLILVNALVAHRNIYLMMAVIGLTGWTTYARYLRAEFLTLRQRDFVLAGIAAGLKRRSIVFRHMLANGLTPVLVSTTFGVASAILYESTLSFLNLGLVDEPSWGGLLNQARAGGSGFVWWIALFPGLAIFLTVFAYNLIGEALRDALDPKLRQR